jgi:hypothetical protein
MALRKQDVDDNDERASQAKEQAQLTIGIDPTLLRRIEKVASEHNLSVDEYLGQILDLIVPKEVSTTEQQWSPPNREALEGLQRVRKLIMQDRQGKPFEDSTEMIRQMREERSHYLEEL